MMYCHGEDFKGAGAACQSVQTDVKKKKKMLCSYNTEGAKGNTAM